uniref:Sucrose-phosphatase C-terminal domain-containing protein n=1 Tax=Brassica oleracea TaxID=3712 RepID=A0A3P6GXD1_BRAOL|nr:unnamed protein product [Brassica oleracea]
MCLTSWSARRIMSTRVMQLWSFSCSMRDGDEVKLRTVQHTQKVLKLHVILLASLFIHLVLKNHSEALLTSLGSTMGTKRQEVRVWTDQVLATETTHGTWIVKLDKWEQTGNERKCCTTTVKFTSKENEGFVWENVQQTWSEESEVKDDSTWII